MSDELTGDAEILLCAEQLIKKKLKGYHIEIELYPSGGVISATGCEQCGTDDNKFDSASWRTNRGKNILTAIEKLTVKLGL